MGLFALPAAILSDRVGPRMAMTICLAGIAGFGVARVVAPEATGVLLLTFGMSMGLGAAQAVVPVAVKEDFPTRPAFATGVYALGINLGSAISSAVSVPIATATGSWRWTLGIYSVLSLGLVLGWLVLTRHAPRHVRSGVAPPRLPWGSGLAWRLAGIFGLMAVTFYGLNAWLPDAYVEQGWSEGAAGALLAVFNIAALATTVTVPWLADRHGSRRLYLTALSGCMAAAVLGLVLVSGAAWLWIVLAGLGIGGLFPMVLTLPLDAAERPADVGALAAMMLFGGYVIGALAPLGLGAARDATGSFTATLWLVVGASAGLFALCASLTRERLHRERHSII